MSAVRIIGIRHHSPACARLVAHAIAEWRPTAVLIEGPSDFNLRLDELLLEHTLPVALYSYANDGERAAQCWFPFLDYSPEWVALRQGHASGATVRFIDLPHWQYRALPDARLRIASTEPLRQDARPARVTRQLCARFRCDGDNALWDHLFESLPVDALDELRQRLDLYFAELRGDDPGTEQDQAREQMMAQWLAWAVATQPRVLVVCGGWHKPALERLWPGLDGGSEPAVAAPADPQAAGSYLVPYEYRQVDALGGYWSGMQSPLFYQWAWQHGLPKACDNAVRRIVDRLRQRQISLTTADLVAFQYTLQGLSQLRGHPVALRTDILDALQAAVIKDALDAPPPWVEQGLLTPQHHPILREALLALTGDGGGRLHTDTPLPPLLHDVAARLAACDIEAGAATRTLILDRRREDDSTTAQTLWQLRLLGVVGVRLTDTRAPNAARSLRPELRFQEHWTLTQDNYWFPNLIEAAAYGATLAGAARNRLLERAGQAGGEAAALAACMLDAIRAGLLDMGEALAEQLRRGVASAHDHAALAAAAQLLLDMAMAGFWGVATQPLLEDVLLALAERILWLLDGHQASGPKQIVGDVQAVRVLDGLLRLRIEGFDAAFTQATLARFARSPDKPPALRGAALGVAYTQDALGDDATAEIIRITRSLPPRDALGDFLYGLFACARALAVESDGITQAIHAALEAMGSEDFLVALPQLRNAFTWFPPRERGALAAHVAQMLGLSQREQAQLLHLRLGAAALVDAKRVEAQALAWAREFGILP